MAPLAATTPSDTPRLRIEQERGMGKDPASIPLVRGQVRHKLIRHGLTRLTEPAESITSELATNAQRHAGGWEAVEITITGNRVVIEVYDNSTVVPDFPLDPPAWSAENGRGLWLVRTAAAETGVDVLPGGKRVRAELSLEQ